MMLTRQIAEDRRLGYEKVVQGDKRTMAGAIWENKTNARVQEQQIIRRFNQLRLQQQERLESRKGALAGMLAEENAQFVHEIANMGETPELRKSRMESRAKQLKDKRETERVKFVEDMNYRRWRASCDDLREADGKNFLLACHLERDKQVLEKVARNELEARENMIFDALWEEERQKRVEMDESQESKLAKGNEDTKQILGEQLVELRARKEDDARIAEQEVSLQRELWEMQEEEERRKNTAAAEAQFKRNQELMLFNVEKLKERAEQLRVERDLDLQFLQMVLDQEARQEAMELAKKEAYSQAAAQYRKHLIALMVKEANDDEYLDGLRADEFEKAWEKRTEVWAREQEARERLMAHVMEERRRQIEEKQMRLEQEKQEEMAARQRLVEAIEQGAGLDQAHISRRALLAEETERVLKAQVRDKEMRKERDALMVMREQRALEIAERQYQQRLAAEKQRMQSQTLALIGHGTGI